MSFPIKKMRNCILQLHLVRFRSSNRNDPPKSEASAEVTNQNQIKKENIKIPPAPTTCCMSGCANCVWIQYAEEISEHFQDSGETVQKMILDQIEDSNMKAFLSMELRVRNWKK